MTTRQGDSSFVLISFLLLLYFLSGQFTLVSSVQNKMQQYQSANKVARTSSSMFFLSLSYLLLFQCHRVKPFIFFRHGQNTASYTSQTFGQRFIGDQGLRSKSASRQPSHYTSQCHHSYEFVSNCRCRKLIFQIESFKIIDLIDFVQIIAQIDF